MIGLYGTRIEYEYGYDGDGEVLIQIRELVATFDKEQDAQDYVKNSTLAAADKPYFRAGVHSGKFRYRKGSLLRYYEGYEIDELEQSTPPPHNPGMAKRNKE